MVLSVAELVGQADIPMIAGLVENAVEGLEQRAVLPGGRVEDDGQAPDLLLEGQDTPQPAEQARADLDGDGGRGVFSEEAHAFNLPQTWQIYDQSYSRTRRITYWRN